MYNATLFLSRFFYWSFLTFSLSTFLKEAEAKLNVGLSCLLNLLDLRVGGPGAPKP